MAYQYLLNFIFKFNVLIDSTKRLLTMLGLSDYLENWRRSIFSNFFVFFLVFIKMSASLFHSLVQTKMVLTQFNISAFSSTILFKLKKLVWDAFKHLAKSPDRFTKKKIILGNTFSF